MDVKDGEEDMDGEDVEDEDEKHAKESFAPSNIIELGFLESIKTSLKGPSINASRMFEDVKIPEVASDEETTDLSVVVRCSAVDLDSGYNVDDFKEGSAMEDSPKCDVCNKYFENKDDLFGHGRTLHEGRCSAVDSDSDFNVNDSMEDCGDDFNEGSAREDGELSMKDDSTEDVVLIR